MATSNEKCTPITILVDIERNPIVDESLKNTVNQNESSIETIDPNRCTQISTIDEIESCSTVFSSDSSVIDDCSNAMELIERGKINTTGTSSGLYVPNLLNVGTMYDCTGIEIGGQTTYNGSVTINHIITNHPNINHQNTDWKKGRIKPGLIVTYFIVVFLLISVIIILVNNISNLTPTPQIFLPTKTTSEKSESFYASEDSLFENSTSDTSNSKRNHANIVEVNWNCKNDKFLATYVTTIMLLLLANFMIYLFMKRCQKSTSPDDDNNSGSEIIVTDTATIRVVSRTQWLAKPPKEILTRLVLPSTRVIIAHTDMNRCSTQETSSAQIRFLQLKHMEENGWDDIGYNFLVGGDGAIYVGRGWDLQGAHSRGFNTKSICIAFIGRFDITDGEPPECQLIAAQKLIAEGVKLKKLAKDYRLYGHRQLRPFDSPGLVLYKLIQKWDHWSPEIKQ